MYAKAQNRQMISIQVEANNTQGRRRLQQWEDRMRGRSMKIREQHREGKANANR